MAEYIDREKLRMYPLRWEFCDKENANPLFIYGVESLMEYVEWLPAADVAPVVRCQVCCFGQKDDIGVMHCHKYHCHKKADGFCDEGERMDGRGEDDGQKD